ncbi:hypothetical protein [Bacillus sp. 491mf]|uniref:hypothetical protein n=1 Tax=Bacillus sp. 491mf TaxID=1761755 RepID=UPI001C436373|nr:hypothetical protein [Bacillus sp. 491mf]
MTKKLFTEKEVQDLSKNPYVKSVSAKEITYTDEFNRIFIKKIHLLFKNPLSEFHQLEE